jgi:hypothetical protein
MGSRTTWQSPPREAILKKISGLDTSTVLIQARTSKIVLKSYLSGIRRANDLFYSFYTYRESRYKSNTMLGEPALAKEVANLFPCTHLSPLSQ